MLKRIIKILLVVLVILLIPILFAGSVLLFELRPAIPTLAVDTITNIKVPEVSMSPDGLAAIENNKFRKNDQGLFEMYLSGTGFERGLKAGALSADQVRYQEEVFVDKITEIIPSERYRSFLLTIIIWFNSKLHKHIHPEFIEEIYGISQSASHEFDFYGPAFYRLLNYHAAHDIGHTLQAYNLVGCSSFAVWDEYSKDSTLLVGRNFDFYFGDDFSANKIIEFVKPDEGYSFAFVTWGGMTGVVSGMNDQGLAVTINAGTPSIAKRSGTPVSLLAREILQFASTIAEADSIAKGRKTFVAESYLVASAKDGKAAVIEKTPYEQELFETSENKIFCTNHYQGELTGAGEENDETRKRATGYRFKRLNQLVDQNPAMDYKDAAKILRDQRGIDDENLGMANEMAMNQLIAHHSVIFAPEKKIMWVSSPPNVLGSYLAYDLNTVFNTFDTLSQNIRTDIDSLEIKPDDFLYTDKFSDYKEYSKLKEKYIFFNFAGAPVADSILDRLIELNPENFEPYTWKADKLAEEGNLSAAVEYYNKALSKVLPEAAKENLEKKKQELTESN